MKSGPTLKGCTLRPRSFRAAKSASVTVVLPTPLCVPAMTSRGKFISSIHLICKLHASKNRSDRRAKEEHFLVVLVEEVINATEDLPLFGHIIGGGDIDDTKRAHFRARAIACIVVPRADEPIIHIDIGRLNRLIA